MSDDNTDPLPWRDATAARLFQDCLDARADLVKLTPSQLEVARLIAKGFMNKEIAKLQGIAEGTVESYLVSANKRLGIRSRLELAVIVTKAGLS